MGSSPVDYSSYSIQQLREAEAAIDPVKFPINYQLLKDEMLRRGLALRVQPQLAIPDPATPSLSIAQTWRRLLRDIIIVVFALTIGGAIAGAITGPPAVSGRTFWIGSIINSLITGVGSYAVVGLRAPTHLWVHLRRVATAHASIALIARATMTMPELGRAVNSNIELAEVFVVILNLAIIAGLGGAVAAAISRKRNGARASHSQLPPN